MIKSVIEDKYTYFQTQESLDIDEVVPGEIVYLKVQSPLNYGNREWEYYGKIVKISPCYFWILEYCVGDRDTKDWKTSEICRKESAPARYTKKWAKKSIIELRRVLTTEKLESRVVWNSI